MKYQGIGIGLWIGSLVNDALFALFPHPVLSALLMLSGLSLFISAVVFTVRAEDERHDQGYSGLGPVGIMAILFSLCGWIVGVYLVSVKRLLLGF